MNESQKTRKKNNTKVSIIIVAFIILCSVIDSLGGMAPLIVFLIILCAAAAIGIYCGIKAHKKRGNPLTGDAEAGHLCRSHNGVSRPKAVPEGIDVSRYRMSDSDRRDKTEEINALYHAGIIDADERAERLAQARATYN